MLCSNQLECEVDRLKVRLSDEDDDVKQTSERLYQKINELTTKLSQSQLNRDQLLRDMTDLDDQVSLVAIIIPMTDCQETGNSFPLPK